MMTIEFVKIISEETHYTGGGCNYLEYQIEILEDGKKSIVYVSLDWENNVIARRVSLMESDSSDDDWDYVEHIAKYFETHCKDVIYELKYRQENEIYGKEKYRCLYGERDYSEFTYSYNGELYQNQIEINGKVYSNFIKEVKKGVTTYFGMDIMTKTYDYIPFSQDDFKNGKVLKIKVASIDDIIHSFNTGLFANKYVDAIEIPTILNQHTREVVIENNCKKYRITVMEI